LDSPTASFDSDLRRVTNDMRHARARLLALIEPLSPNDLARSRPGGWSAGHVLQHVIESEAVYVKLLAHQTGGTAPEMATDGPATASDATAMLAATRNAAERMIEGIGEATFYELTKFGHEEYSPLSVLENVASHDREHITQITDVMGAARPAAAMSWSPPSRRVSGRSVQPIIRPAGIDDVPRMTAIYNHYIVHTAISFDLEPFTVDERRAWFEHYSTSGRHRLFVAESGGGVLGYAASSPFRPKRAYQTTVETTIVCAPEAVGLGIGGKLYGALFSALQEEDVHLAVAGITVPNHGSVDLHERFGFTRAALFREVGRKFDQYWDVAWYERRMR
jgi:phosphinothricin acetyltransferase